MSYEFGKRELNKAKTRLNILDVVYKLGSTTNFEELMVTTIADKVGITEKTFYNYFPKKEDILKYMTSIWWLDLFVKQHEEPLKGELAIRRIFEHTAKNVNEHPKLMASYVASLLTRDLEASSYNIEAVDRYVLYPDLPFLYEMYIPSGNEILIQHIMEIDPSQDPTNKLLHLATSFYGSFLVAHTSGIDINKLYNDSLNMIFNIK